MVERKDKQLIAFLVVVSVVAIFFGLWRVKNDISSPFIRKVTNTALSSSNTAQQLAELKTKDTDEDGLNDYDELYEYETSPYLADSDSDGYVDKEEVDSGNDPNCPAGKECLQTRTIINVNDSITNSSSTNSGINSASSVTVAAQLRQVLKDAGVPQATLDAMDDATLLQFYSEAIAQSNVNVNSPYAGFVTNTEPFTNVNTTDTLSSLANMNVADVRNYLISNGVDKETLDKYDDATVMEIFQQALQQE
jgi:hypothetical protein